MSEVNLPEGWNRTTLAEVAEWGSGGTPSRKEASYYEGNIPWVKTGDLGPKVITSASENISELAVQNSSAKYFPKGSVAIAMYGATIGKTSILGIDATTNQACGVGNPIDRLTFSEFLYYFLLNEKDNFIAKGKGGAQPNISQALIKEHEIVLPPLAEQKVIADKLDSLLTQVETTKARLERIPNILKTFRQSVLAAAVSGKLTEVQVNSIGQIKDCASVVSGLAFKKAEYSHEGSRLLQIANVGYGITKWDSPNYIPLELAESCLEYSMQAGDIVLALNRPITNDTLKVAWIRDEDLPATLYQRVARLRCNESLIDPRYLFLAMQSKEFLEVVSKNLKGSDQPYLNTSDLSSFSIAAPEKEEQTEIVHRVEELFAFADNIEQKANAALERVNNLTQSILAKAFRGELTADWRAANPDLISGENSAEALLAKIQAEREKLALEKKAANKTRKKKA